MVYKKQVRSIGHFFINHYNLDLRPPMVFRAFVPFGMFLLLAVFSTANLQAADLSEAIEQSVYELTEGRRLSSQKSRSIVIEVVNQHSKRRDALSQRIETELYRALGHELSGFKLFYLDDSLSGIDLNRALMIRGEYNKSGRKIVLRLRASSGAQGQVIAQSSTKFDAPKGMETQLVAVLDLEAPSLNRNQKKVYSDIFRGALVKAGSFQLASSAEVAKMNPDDIQKAAGCSRDECATIIGRQLGVDRVISTSYLKVGKGVFFLSAKVMDIKSGATVASETVEHDGKIRNLKVAVRQLATLLSASNTPEPMTFQARSIPTQPQPIQEVRRDDGGGWPWWSYALVGLIAVGAASGSSSNPDSGTGTSGGSGGSDTGSATITW